MTDLNFAKFSVFWVVPANGVAMDTSLPRPEVLKPYANL